MSELILHHYDISPYAEKIRLIFGLKQLPWRSVAIPVVMPKPDLTALTGGYRLTPVLQIGADLYCDTQVIARRIEREWPEPPLDPPGSAALTRGLSHWGESMFLDIVAFGFSLENFFPSEFVEDRESMIPGGVNLDLMRAVAPSKLDQVRAKVDRVESQLRDGRPHLLGDALTIADLCVYHPLWGLRAMPTTETLFEPWKNVRAWMDRIGDIGHGERSEMDAAEAIEIARAAQPAPVSGDDACDRDGARLGDRVQVLHEAYGRDPVAGELVAADLHEIAIARSDPRVGDVIVHFPREGFIVLPAA